MQSRSVGWRRALARALSAAAFASPTPVSPGPTQYRVLIHERCTIHSSDVSIIPARSSLVTRREGTWKPVARNSVRGIGLRPFGKERRFRPPPAKAREPMDLAVTRAQYDAVRAAKHLPDVLKQALAKAAANGDGYTLHLTYEEATALNELCSWNVHTDAQGDVTPDTKVYDELVRAIMTHPEF